MYRAFPCSDYYGNSVVISDIQRPTPIALSAFRLRQSPFSGILTISITDWRMRLSLLSAYCGCVATLFYALTTNAG